MAEKADSVDDPIFDLEEDSAPRSDEERARFLREVIESVERSMKDPRPDITMEEMRAHLDALKLRARTM